MADAAMTFLLQNVKQLVEEYSHLIASAENELRLLKDELDILQAFLRKAAKQQDKEDVFKVLERQIRELVYKAEDTIDTCLIHTATAKGKNFSCLAANAKRISLAKQVKSLREDKVMKQLLQEAKQAFPNIRIGDGSGVSTQQPLKTVKEEYLSRPKDKVIGFEQEEASIIKALKKKRKELDVISIVGMPGRGKTTLAWKIFNDKGIRSHFEHCIWVTISQEFDKMEVFRDILQHFDEEDMLSLRDQALVTTVQTCLEKPKFFLVVDDVWTDEAWNSIWSVLPKSNGESKVLVTSRENKVGADVTRKPIMLRKLDEEESWKLLQLEVFQSTERCPEELRDIGTRIANQCDGLPLAIVVVGGILRGKFSEQTMKDVQDEWEKASQDLSNTAANFGEQQILNIVALSYNALPDDLKPCFLYLGVFPEDYEIPVWTLIHLWIAEGFIRPKEKQSLEEIAYEYLRDLIGKNLVIVGETTPNGKIKKCRVQDMIRQFCIFKAGYNELNLFEEIKKSKGRSFGAPISNINKYRRLCIHSELSDFLKELVSEEVKSQCPPVRSFLCFYEEPCVLDPNSFSTIPDTFNLLRVLDSKSMKLTEFPVKITELTHLRFITLSFDDLKLLPESIAELWNLQTLLVDTNSRTLEIEANIWRMNQLMYLKSKAEIILKAKKGGGKGGKNLATLSRLSPECCKEDVFKRACNLNKLGIQGCLAGDFTLNFLKKLECLENLKLVNHVLGGSPSEKPLQGLPDPHCFPKNIKRLTLSATHLGWRHMRTLGEIDTLEVLKLKNKAFTGQSWHVEGGFNCLRFLLISNIDLVFWRASDNQFPKLTCLVINNCVKLSQIPLGLAKSLHILEIEHSKSAEKSARRIENEKLKQGQQNARWGGFKLTIKS